MVDIICPPPVGIGLTDLPNIGGGPSGPPGPYGSGITATSKSTFDLFLKGNQLLIYRSIM